MKLNYKVKIKEMLDKLIDQAENDNKVIENIELSQEEYDLLRAELKDTRMHERVKKGYRGYEIIVNRPDGKKIEEIIKERMDRKYMRAISRERDRGMAGGNG